MKKLLILCLAGSMVVFAGCRSTMPGDETIPDYQITVEASAGEEGIIMALQSLSELGGGTLTLSEGVFVIDAPIRLISNMILQGQGENTVIKLADGYNDDIVMIYGNGVSNVVVRDLVVDGNKTKQASGEQHGIFFENSSNVTVENATVKNCRVQGLTFGVNTKNCTGGKIKSFSNHQGVVITSNTSITNSFIYSNEYAGINVVSGENVIISGNYVYQNEWAGIYVASGENVIISDNFAYQNGWNGIWVEVGNRVQIIKNKSYDNVYEGLDLRELKNSLIQNNEAYLNGRNGISMLGSEGNPFANNEISGNILYANNQSDAGYRNLSLGPYCINNTVQQNVVRVGDKAKKPSYGIYILIRAENNLITNNDLYQSGTTAAIRDDGTDTNFGAGNRVNDGRWIVGADYTP